MTVLDTELCPRYCGFSIVRKDCNRHVVVLQFCLLIMFILLFIQIYVVAVLKLCSCNCFLDASSLYYFAVLIIIDLHLRWLFMMICCKNVKSLW